MRTDQVGEQPGVGLVVECHAVREDRGQHRERPPEALQVEVQVTVDGRKDGGADHVKAGDWNRGLMIGSGELAVFRISWTSRVVPITSHE